MFLFNGKPIKTTHFTSKLKLALAAIGEDASKFNSHSFRIGAATFWASQGNSELEIQRLGRWQSNAFKKYIRDTVVHSC